MKIIDVRDGFIKFEADKSIYLSSFIQIFGMSKNYIAQVSQLKTFGEVSIAIAKILFVYEDEQLKNYDKTEPSKDAEIKSFTLNILDNSVKATKPVILGKTLDNSGFVKIDVSAFNKKMLISVDDKNMNNILIRNLSKQFENLGKKTVVIDTLGVVSAKSFKAGVDFKLPLDTSSLAFMYESCLNDATSDSKSTIVEIFRDLSEYSKTIPFVPFGALKSIVDDMVDNQHIFKLLVLKNKLAKFEKLGYFALSQNEVDNLNKILEQKCAIIDLSGMDTLFQNRYLAFIYEKLSGSEDVQILLETANTVSKKNLKNIISDSELPTTLVTHSRFQYLNDIKNMFDNFIIEPTIANNAIFKIYSTFLGSMKKNTYLIAGEAINYIPIVSEAQIIDDVVPYAPVEKPIEELVEEIPEEPVEETVAELLEESVEKTEIAEGIEDYSLQTEPTEEVKEPEEVEPLDIIPDENDREIVEISIDEDTKSKVEPIYSQEELINAIDEKSDNAIAEIAENLETPDEIDLFENDEEEKINETVHEDISELETDATEIADTEETEDTELPDFAEENNKQTEATELIDTADELLSEEKTEELTEDDLQQDLTSVNDDSVNISELPDEDIAIEEDELSQGIPTDELSDGILEEDSSNLTEDLLLEQENPEQAASDVSEPENTELLEGNTKETTIELDSDVEMLLDEQDDSTEEEYPQSNALDVDFSEPKIMPLTGEALNHDFDEIVELDSSEATEDDIIVDISNDEQININEEIEQEIMEDVDKVYTTMKDENELEEISDSDLDLIDELNNDGEELEEYHGELEEVSDSNDGILEEVHQEPAHQSNSNDADEILEHKESSTPIVPLYDADIPQEDMVMSDPIQQGDAVVHAKYGNGVVEKMIKYGNKTLFAINFENIGRRLLDPTLTEIKRV